MSDEMNKGTCHYCGQQVFIQTVGELDQSELDQMATDKCMCPEAQSERRKRERREKIDEYIKEHFSSSKQNFVREAVAMIEDFSFDKISLNFDSKTCTIWLDSDSWLHMKIQHREDDELKV